MAHLNLSDFDIGGFSLGARTVAKLLVEGLQPRRAILAGMGLEGLSGWAKRREFFLTAIDARDTVKRGEPHWMAVQFMHTMKIDTEGAAPMRESFVDLETASVAGVDPEPRIVRANGRRSWWERGWQ